MKANLKTKPAVIAEGIEESKANFMKIKPTDLAIKNETIRRIGYHNNYTMLQVGNYRVYLTKSVLEKLFYKKQFSK